jgi:hypothetical protein
LRRPLAGLSQPPDLRICLSLGKARPTMNCLLA